MSELFGGTGPLGSLTRRVAVLEGVKPSSIGTSRDQRLDVLEAKLSKLAAAPVDRDVIVDLSLRVVELEKRLAQVKPCSCAKPKAKPTKPARKPA